MVVAVHPPPPRLLERGAYLYVEVSLGASPLNGSEYSPVVLPKVPSSMKNAGSAPRFGSLLRGRK